MVLSLSHINKAYGGDVILDDVSLLLEDREKAAIIGANGAGKSTLLKIVAGVEKADSGDIGISHNATIGYLSQHQDEALFGTIREVIISSRPDILEMEERLRSLEEKMNLLEGDELTALLHEYDKIHNLYDREGGYSYKSEALGVLRGLGFEEDEFDKNVSQLSGGQKTRVALGRLLVQKPDVLLLDEPINHLDLSSVAWLEGFLLSYPKAVLIIAHDRYFLDKVVTKVIEISGHHSTMYKGNYTDFRQKKAIVETAEINAYEKQKKEIAHQEAVITKLESFNREKSIKRAESRKKMLDKIERLEKPVEEDLDMKLTLKALRRSGEDVLFADELKKSYNGRTLFDKLSFEVHRGQRIGLVGDNGTGKSTILKIINGLVEPDEGSVSYGTQVDVGYYDQEQQLLDMNATVFDELHDAYPHLNNTQIRCTLGAFLFKNDDVFKRIGDLSGGERGRVSLAKLMLSGSNFLILDEPTNHLDMISKEILEDALKDFEGTVLFVSHDRYFINQVADVIFELEGGKITKYLGNYDDYITNKEQRLDVITSTPDLDFSHSKAKDNSSVSENKTDWQTSKEEKAKKAKLAKELSNTEAAIDNTEKRKKELEELLYDPQIATNSVRLQEITNKINECDEKLMELMEKWEKLSE